MNGSFSSQPDLNNCAEVAPLLIFYTCNEVEPHEREQIDAHLAKCQACRSLLGE
jgi:predicted anti-sigma-YlaC factor YlaD